MLEWEFRTDKSQPDQILTMLLNCPDMESPWLNGTWECNQVPPTPQVMSTDLYSQLNVLAFSFSISLGFDCFTKLQKFSNIFQCSSQYSPWPCLRSKCLKYKCPPGQISSCRLCQEWLFHKTFKFSQSILTFLSIDSTFSPLDKQCATNKILCTM